MNNILTIDVEDYFQVENLKDKVKFSDWDKYELRVVKNTEKILSILDSFHTKATFFVLGWVAEKCPNLVKAIDRAGHEVASHGYAHELIYCQGPEGFTKDILKAKKIIEGIIQKPVIGYRAPCYSITVKSEWGLDILSKEGFKYDSSIFPIQHDRGGLPAGKRFPYEVKVKSGEFWEFPISTVRILGLNLPFSGGGYFRLLPYSFISNAIKSINRKGLPVNVYLHPWEFDPQQPRIAAGALNSFRHYLNLSRTEGKFKRLLADFSFTSIRGLLGAK